MQLYHFEGAKSTDQSKLSQISTQELQSCLNAHTNALSLNQNLIFSLYFPVPVISKYLCVYFFTRVYYNFLQTDRPTEQTTERTNE